jgi:ABC-type amino acid transport/signal transduction systems, periplasmic component/domain
MRSITRGVGIGLIAVIVAACGAGASTASPVATTVAPTTAVTAEPTRDACATANLALTTAGKLTVGTDNPAYPPYFAIRTGGNTPPWEDLGYTGDPTTGEGFESAAAYAIAKQLGFTAAQVTWVVVPFVNSYAPGPKTFDFDINQVSYTAERAAAADLSAGYYTLNQAVVALKDNPAAGAKTLAELKGYKFGAMQGTTSYNAIVKVIAPTTETSVYDTNDAALTALKDKQIDALVVDLPTADFNVNVQIENNKGTIVGQLPPFGGTPEYFSLVLAKGSALTPCVNAAIAALTADGTLGTLASTWLPFQDAIPVLK